MGDVLQGGTLRMLFLQSTSTKEDFRGSTLHQGFQYFQCSEGWADPECRTVRKSQLKALEHKALFISVLEKEENRSIDKSKDQFPDIRSFSENQTARLSSWAFSVAS